MIFFKIIPSMHSILLKLEIKSSLLLIQGDLNEVKFVRIT